MVRIIIYINGFQWWYADMYIYEFETSTCGIHIYSKHICESEREQIKKQINL